MEHSRWGLRAEERGRITSLDLLTAPRDAAQDVFGFLGCKRSVLAPVQLFIHKNPKVLLHRADLHDFFCQSVLSGIALTQLQHLALAEPQEVLMLPLLQFVQVPLDGIPSLCCASCTAQLYAICKLAEGALGPTVMNKDTKETEPQGAPLSTSLGIESLATTLWLHPSSQCLIYQTVHLSNPCLSSLKTGMLCGNHLPCFSSDFVPCPLEPGKVSKLV